MNSSPGVIPPDDLFPDSAFPDNAEIASRLQEIAELLALTADNPFRARAYRAAAEQVKDHVRPLADIVASEGHEGLLRISSIGTSIARTIAGLLRRDRLPLLERLRRRVAKQNELMSLPGIGLQLARRIQEQLGISTVQGLEGVVYSGRLSQVPGMGRKRILAIRQALRSRSLGRRTPRPAEPASPPEEPNVAELLDIDLEYRSKARSRRLPIVAPRRFNPTHAAWLPVMETNRGPRRYTVRYSNSSRAHQAGGLFVWVVIQSATEPASFWTVLTAAYGSLRGHRVVRGRETECREHYRETATRQQYLPLE
jgi:DNA polymerase (family 10)